MKYWFLILLVSCTKPNIHVQPQYLDTETQVLHDSIPVNPGKIVSVSQISKGIREYVLDIPIASESRSPVNILIYHAGTHFASPTYGPFQLSSSEWTYIFHDSFAYTYPDPDDQLDWNKLPYGIKRNKTNSQKNSCMPVCRYHPDVPNSPLQNVAGLGWYCHRNDQTWFCTDMGDDVYVALDVPITVGLWSFEHTFWIRRGNVFTEIQKLENNILEFGEGYYINGYWGGNNVAPQNVIIDYY